MIDWIKVEDQLPGSHNGKSEWSEEMIVLVRHSGYSDDMEAYYNVRVAIYHTRIKQWFENGDEVIGVYPTETVVAWQPLPPVPEGCRTLAELHAAMFDGPSQQSEKDER